MFTDSIDLKSLKRNINTNLIVVVYSDDVLSAFLDEAINGGKEIGFKIN